MIFDSPERGYRMARYDGTDADDVYLGTVSSDQIYGNGGRDDLAGEGGDDEIHGGSGNDHILGGDGDDMLFGDGGRNVLEGGSGDDVMYSTGKDRFSGGDGTDRWIGDYSARSDAVTYDGAKYRFSNGIGVLGAERIDYLGGSGDDQFLLSDLDPFNREYWHFDAGEGDDTLVIDSSDGGVERPAPVSVIGEESFSVLGGYVTNVEHVRIIANENSQNFVIDATPLLHGCTIDVDAGAGIDRLLVRYQAYDSIRFIVGANGLLDSPAGSFTNFEMYRVVTGTGANAVVLGDGDDVISANLGVGNRLDAGDGNDEVEVGGSLYVADGGRGNDLLRVTLSENGWFDQESGSTSDGAFFAFERYSLLGTAGAETFNIISLAVEEINELFTYGLADTLNANLLDLSHGIVVQRDLSIRNTLVTVDSLLAYNIGILNLVATSQDDWFRGSNLGTAGADIIDAGDGVDVLTLTYLSTISSDFILRNGEVVVAQAGTYRNFERFEIQANLSQSANTARIVTGDMDDVIRVLGDEQSRTELFAFAGDDLVIGSLGQDRLLGGEGDDRLFGGENDDALGGADGSDLLDGGVGADTATYRSAGQGVTVRLDIATAQDTRGAGTDTLVSIENLTGSDYADRFMGSGLRNVLDGQGGDDRLFGGDGADVLIGGDGTDRLSGGGGADRFTYASVGAAVHMRDRIVDFSHADRDRIDLSGIDAQAGSRDDQAFSFIADARFSGAAGELRAHVTANGAYLIQGDCDADGRADFSILVRSDAPLIAADFVL